ncbi:ATP-binding protein [Trebonia kvetii]|uniref:ATP-binding protein n=1 Tax=Trebonia kvetii TaxID=2480626 RepID=A0A6P2CD22_9ACTN|nr:ATP-binding protein [Trebonia kvetii]
MIGREEEQRRLQEALDAAGARGQSLGIVGDPGTGKSALLAGAATDARRGGFTVLSARGTKAAAQRTGHPRSCAGERARPGRLRRR